jgi:prepilin-type N-terminal cleavage/methylation domain-containing protein/prepilin-type processing-associated H-X9-DG protein
VEARVRRAFTLVELLVVIGIIAVLIAILMPALARVRMSASLVRCQSNFRQVYSALSSYVNENKGFLPRCSDPDRGVTGTFEQTFVRITELLGSKVSDATTDPLHPVMTCGEASQAGDGTLVWAPNMLRTIQFHPRAFPGYDQAAQMSGEYPQRKLASIRNSADKIAFYEGPQIPIWNMCPEPESIFLDGWRWSWGHQYADPPADGDYSRWEQPIETGLNRDDGWWVCSMRFRHMKQTTTPVAFFDGHVESRRIGEVKVKEICISR